MTDRHTTLAVLVSLALATLVSVAIVPGAVVAQSQTQSGTVTVEDGSADGANVTVAPLNGSSQLAADPVETTVENGSFSYDLIEGASTYFVQLEHGNLSHYQLITDGEEPAFVLNETASRTLVAEDGQPVSNATVNVTSEFGPDVGQVTTNEDGSVTLDSLQPDRTYALEIEANGARYRELISTGNGTTDETTELAEPTGDRDELRLGGGQPANHVMQVGPTESGDGLFVVETVSLENGADRPFVGPVDFEVPTDAEVVLGMVRDERADVETENGTATVNASIEANETAEVSVFYQLENRDLEKAVGYDVEQFALSFQEYDLNQVESSENLVEADAPMPMLTNADALAADEQIAVSIDEDGGAVASDELDDDSQGGDLPLGLLSVAFVAIVVGGLVAYRRL
ncbi:carboxypeptidase-like regulatory domain-containing protein [Natronococcus jeotgali]|uniref:Carboxypeptidase regulatory-like domain-containing protein n=1 Tax=Natronococcus jeotgali DSM 18795 TaxID=1227498 RepID=L9XR78_9EURY|nr:carboxypeptidase-like regulatory domain-containing protein [Natronococcus jeotgali]ELY64007.1 hypothetical protein C492_05787 [Natronococcus jeotgali DSM 18795]